MDYIISLYSCLLALLAAVAIGIALHAWRHRTASGGLALLLMTLSVIVWVIAYAIEISLTRLDIKILLAKVQYIGIASLPLCWLLFAQSLAYQTSLYIRRYHLAIAVLPVVTLTLVWTNEAHGLIWQNQKLSVVAPFPAIDKTYGYWFWIHSAYSYGLTIWGTLLLIHRLRKTAGLYHSQMIALLIGIIAPWLGNALYISGLSPIPHLDLTPFAFTVTGIAFGASLFRLRLLDVVPIAREAMIEAMRESVIALDLQHRIIDANPAAARLLATPTQKLLGQSITEVLPIQVELLQQVMSQGEVQGHLTWDATGRTYEVTLVPIYGRNRQHAGALLMLRDIAERLHALTALRESEARYRDVSTLTSDFTYALRIAANGRLELEWITDAFTRITGYTCAEVRELGGWTTLIHEDDLPIAQRDAKAIFSGETRVTEVRLITKCGSIRWMRTYGKGVWDNNGQRVIRILGAGQDITARKQAEADRERERDLLTTIINTIPDGIYLKDRESRFIRINQAQARHLGVERVEDAIGKTDFDFFGLTHAQEAFDDEQRIINTGEPMLDRLEHYIAVDGQPIWISATKVPLRNEHGDIIGTVGISRDITARKHAEEALRETEERYRQMFHEHRAIKLLIDPCSGAIVDANQGAADFYGYPLKTLTTMHIYEINTLPADVLLPKFRAAAQREQSHFIFQHRLCSGVIRDVEVNTGPVTVKGRRLLYSIVHDITERRKAEHALRQQNEYLAVLYETTLAVINRLEVADVLDAIVVRAASLAGTTHGFIYLYESGGTSTNSLERHGTRGELIMKVGQGLYRPYVGMRTTQPRGLVGEVWRTGQPLVISDYRTWPGRSPESRWDQLDAVMGVPLTSDGQVIGVLGLAHTEAGRRFHDEEIATLSRFAQLASIALDNARLYTTAQLEILERKRAEERLALARDEAIEAARLKSGFLAMMSHELRTPLNAIIGFTELTLNEHAGPLNQSQRSNLERVSRNAQNLLDIINSILDMSKIDAGYMQLGDEKVSLEEIVRGAVAGIETMLSTKRLKLHVEHLCCGGTSVRGDAMRLHQITLNLLSNAVKFTPESGTIMVTIECGSVADIVAGAVPGDQAPDGEWVVLSVIDTGIGIPPMEQERIWSEFYQIDASTTREYGGTGLGLAIVKRLTLLMGGQVGLRSKPGQGSTFSIWLPPMQVDEPPAQPVPTPTIAEIEYSGDSWNNLRD